MLHELSGHQCLSAGPFLGHRQGQRDTAEVLVDASAFWAPKAISPVSGTAQNAGRAQRPPISVHQFPLR